MKNKSENIFKRWYKLCEPNKKYWFWQTFFYIIYAVLIVTITIFAARTINCMYMRDWRGAFINLGIEIANIAIRNIALHIQYEFYALQISHIRGVVAKKLYTKLIACEDKGIKDVSKEKITNIVTNNMSNLSEFPDAISGAISYSLQVIIALVTVFVSNLWAGLIVAVLGVINLIAFLLFNKKMGKMLFDRNEKKDEIYKSYIKIIDGRDVIKEAGKTRKYKNELLGKVDEHAKSYGDYYMVYSWKNNIWFAVWNVIIYAVTFFLMWYVSKGNLGMETYLIVVPYLSSCTSKLTSLFDKTSALENMRVDVDRVNLILELNDRQLVKFGNSKATAEGYNLGLVDVSYNSSDEYLGGRLNSADISFKMGSVNLIKGAKKSGKRVVFNLLRRYIKPDSGTVLLDNLNLYYYNEKTFKNHINYCSSHPSFVHGTIKENLLMYSKDFKKAKQVCEQLGIVKYINKLPKKYNTDIREVKSSSELFLLGLARASLSNCKILMIYELPQDAPDSFRKRVKKLVSEIKNKTIILFTHSNDYDDIAELCYEVSKGNVKLVSAKRITKQIKPRTKQISKQKVA